MYTVESSGTHSEECQHVKFGKDKAAKLVMRETVKENFDRSHGKIVEIFN